MHWAMVNLTRNFEYEESKMPNANHNSQRPNRARTASWFASSRQIYHVVAKLNYFVKCTLDWSRNMADVDYNTEKGISVNPLPLFL